MCSHTMAQALSWLCLAMTNAIMRLQRHSICQSCRWCSHRLEHAMCKQKHSAMMVYHVIRQVLTSASTDLPLTKHVAQSSHGLSNLIVARGVFSIVCATGSSHVSAIGANQFRFSTSTMVHDAHSTPTSCRCCCQMYRASSPPVQVNHRWQPLNSGSML